MIIEHIVDPTGKLIRIETRPSPVVEEYIPEPTVEEKIKAIEEVLVSKAVFSKSELAAKFIKG